MKNLIVLFIIGVFLAACSGKAKQGSLADVDKDIHAPVPGFDHIVWIVLENQDYQSVIGNKDMPFLNDLASMNVLLRQYASVSHPSLPNYIALIAGDTYGIKSDCIDCFLKNTSLPDLLEKSGHTWKTYQEDMPSACFLGNDRLYVQKHNPFVYFDSIRLNSERCKRSVVPLAELDQDLASRALPDFAFISPNLCHSGHNCSLHQVDDWLNLLVSKLTNSPALGKNSLIAITFDEGDEKKASTCCGAGQTAGGHVATIILSPLAKPGFTDDTSLSHYSLLKTVLLAWRLPDLGVTSQASVLPITAPWDEVEARR